MLSNKCAKNLSAKNESHYIAILSETEIGLKLVSIVHKRGQTEF